MLRGILAVVILVCISHLQHAQPADIDFIETPDAVTEYLEEYLLVGSLINYFIETQVDTNCEIDWLELKYKDEYVFFCIFDDIKDGSSHLFVGIGGEAYLAFRQLLILWNGSLMHHEFRSGPTTEDIRTWIPSVEQQPGEYVVYVSIEDDGESADTTAQFTIEPMEGMEE